MANSLDSAKSKVINVIYVYQLAPSGYLKCKRLRETYASEIPSEFFNIERTPPMHSKHSTLGMNKKLYMI